MLWDAEFLYDPREESCNLVRNSGGWELGGSGGYHCCFLIDANHGVRGFEASKDQEFLFEPSPGSGYYDG